MNNIISRGKYTLILLRHALNNIIIVILNLKNFVFLTILGTWKVSFYSADARSRDWWSAKRIEVRGEKFKFWANVDCKCKQMKFDNKNTCSRRWARETVREQIFMIKFSFISDWLRMWRETLTQPIIRRCLTISAHLCLGDFIGNF